MGLSLGDALGIAIGVFVIAVCVCCVVPYVVGKGAESDVDASFSTHKNRYRVLACTQHAPVVSIPVIVNAANVIV